MARSPELSYVRETRRRRGGSTDPMFLLLVAGVGWAFWRSSKGLPVIPSNLVVVGGTVQMPSNCGCGR